MPSIDYFGTTFRVAYNPGCALSWTADAPQNYEGLSVEFGDCGPRAFGSTGLVTGINGSVSVPAISTLTAHACGVSGYAKTASPTTAGVALYGEGSSQAAGALVWGLNTRSLDNGHHVPVLWGAEIDLNVDNPNTIPIGVEVTGGSTVEPSNSIGFKVSPLNPFNTLKVRWLRAFMSDDGAAHTVLEVGSKQTEANSGSQDVRFFYRDGSNNRVQCFGMSNDGAGNTTMVGGQNGGIFQLGAGTDAGVIRMHGSKLGFFGATPTPKATITGSKSGNVALDSLLIELERLGLIRNSTT